MLGNEQVHLFLVPTRTSHAMSGCNRRERSVVQIHLQGKCPIGTDSAVVVQALSLTDGVSEGKGCQATLSNGEHVQHGKTRCLSAVWCVSKCCPAWREGNSLSPDPLMGHNHGLNGDIELGAS